MTSTEPQTRNLLIAFSIVLVASLLTGVAGYWYFLAGIPALALYGYVAVVDFKKIFFLLLAFLPLTVEVWLPNGVVTDLPTEPMMVAMMGIYFLYVLKRGKSMLANFVRHPIALLLLLHLGWMFFTVITSEAFVISFKFFLAKIWYVTTFFFLAGTLLKTEKDVKSMVWVVLVPLVLTILYVLVRHASYGFSFADVNKVMFPFYRNKVAYACMLSIFLPFVWLGRGWYRRFSLPWWTLLGAALLLLVGIQFSYTRAAYLTLALAAGSYFVVKWRLMKIVLGLAAIGSVLFVATQLKHRTWLDEKPIYEKTITHERFDDLLSATTKGRDVSTMERVYRWVAGGHMVAEKPLLGFGPGTFTKFYKSYTVTGFTTYVSSNPEGSGIHCYYLMTFVEQGVAGGLLFLALVAFVLLKAEVIYHQTTDPDRRRIVMMVILTTVVIDGLLLMNDLVETDKTGSFFFMCMALLVNADIKNKEQGEMNSEERPEEV
ncbi:MAG: O-antigen ligase family protein [Saprospiraceae bacterium]|nr:MAG: O-antigen ligase family protein [Saprospiraceae bacterium]